MELDTTEETQVTQKPKPRTIYDVSKREIALRSFMAGFFLGIGRTLASIVLWAAALIIFVQLLQPLMDPLIRQWDQLMQILQFQSSANPAGSSSIEVDQILSQFGSRQ